jgi:CubicO group peptidase (beta-lactamase class C family)
MEDYRVNRLVLFRCAHWAYSMANCGRETPIQIWRRLLLRDLVIVLAGVALPFAASAADDPQPSKEQIKHFLETAEVTKSRPSSEGGPSRPESPSTRVDKLFAEWTRPDSPGCSVAVSRNGTLLNERGYGMANLELGVPITPTSVMSAASISKQFTAMSILLLAERGQLSLDDEVTKFFPEWTDREQHITIRHLLTHTSGLRDGFALLGWAIPSDGRVDTNDAILAMLARQRGVNFAPGTQFQTTTARSACLARSSSVSAASRSAPSPTRTSSNRSA